MKIEKRIFVCAIFFFAVSLITISCDFGMRPPEPVVVDKPEGIRSVSFDTSFFILHISTTKIFISHGSATIDLQNWKALDTFLKKKGPDIKLALKCDDSIKPAYKRIDSAISVLKENKIFQFNLVTDLEKDPNAK